MFADNRVWVSVEWLCKHLGYERQTIYKWIRYEAERAGFDVYEKVDRSGRTWRFLALDQIGGIPRYEASLGANKAQLRRRRSYKRRRPR